jgi:4-carboxymuconolactone decarboxylase
VNPDDLHAQGMRTRRQVLGDAHVARAEASKTDFDEAFQRFITESAWGSVWSRPQLDQRTRSLVTIALLGALGHYGELEMHVKAARRTGAQRSEIAEALLHVAVYAGVPAANRAFAAARRALEEIDSLAGEE